MRNSIFYYKELTPAEVGNTGTHEIYVRMPNNFDYESFFKQAGTQNGSVLEVNVSALDITNGVVSAELEPIRFVYFANSNQEKRLPGLRNLFEKHQIKEGDIFCIESRTEGETTSFIIKFYRKGTMELQPSQIYFSKSYGGDSVPDGENDPLQKIFYGAPGTGKSHEVKKQTGELTEDDEEIDLPNVFRTTFHPDTDYASFVGCYKPTMKPTTNAAKTLSGKEEEIVYEYVPQVFTDAYVHAYNNPDEPTYLVIEEINRGNCAQIFGDLFQLLDRKKGKSEYKIKADKDLAKYLCEAKDKDGQDVLKDKEGIKDGKLCLPSNLHILATMNTSDQSLFPMDSAFKRRWDWEYIPIKYCNKNWRIDIAGNKYSWVDFQDEINKKIFGATESEDKQLGDFFVKADENNIISSKLLLNKVIFYLWNDVCKDGDGDIFIVNTDLDYSKELDPAMNEDITFSKFFKETDLKLKQWMRYLNIKPLESQEYDDEEKEDESHQQEEGVKPTEAKPDTYSKPEYKSIIENMLPQLSNEDIKIFGNGFDWSFSEMPGSYARVVLTLDAPAKNKKAAVKLWVPALSGYSRSAECFAFLKDQGGEEIIRTTASKYGYEYEELGIHSKNPNPVVGWKITIPMTFAPENSQTESQNLLNILSEVRTAFDPIISDFQKK